VSADGVVVSITEAFENLTEPRVERTRYHDLIDIVVIAICGTICGCDSWEDLPRYGKAKIDWLRTFLWLPNGIPSADTFARVFQRLDPSEFMNCMSSWVDALRERVGEEIVSIDGKTVRGSGNAQGDCKPLHMVRAWASENHLVLGEQACEEKSNEITAIPKLLELIELSGAIVTIDAMGCQTEIVNKIREKEADYLLSVKDNQPTLKQHIAEAFEGEIERAAGGQPSRFRRHVTRENKRGREEERSYYVLPAPKTLRLSKRWTDVKSIGMVIRRRTFQGEEQICVHYYISSLSPLVRRFARVVRSHWSIENSLHWMLDVNFAEDQSRIRKGASPEIASMLRQLALMILKHDTKLKGSVRGKRKIAGWNNQALESLLLNFTAI
jgi:predicted transposase YbfD/YdcC